MESFVLVLVMLLGIIEEIKENAVILIPILITGFIGIKLIGPKIKDYKRKQKLQFNEYEDIDKIRQQQEENEQLENELEKTKTKKLIRDVNKEILDGVPISAIKQDDNSFDADLFKKWSRNIFLYLQLGNIDELKQIRSSISEIFYGRRLQMLKDFERDNLELKREDLLIEEIKILDYAKWMDKAQIKIFIKARLKEYIINKSTQEIIRGSDKKLNERGFILTFQKKDAEQQVGFVTNCPNCGASIADTEFGTCQYCGSLVNPIRYNWTLIKYEVL